MSFCPQPSPSQPSVLSPSLPPLPGSNSDGAFYPYTRDQLVLIAFFMIMIALMILSLKRWEPLPEATLDRERLDKVLDNFILLSGLMVAFALTMPASFNNDMLREADERLTDKTFLACTDKFLNAEHFLETAPSLVFYRRIFSSVTYLGAAMVFSFMMSTSLAFLGEVDPKLLTRVVTPVLGFICIMVLFGTIQFFSSFLTFMHIVAPMSFDRSFMRIHGILYGLFGIAPAIIIFYILKRRRRLDLDMKSGKMKDNSDHMQV